MVWGNVGDGKGGNDCESDRAGEVLGVPAVGFVDYETDVLVSQHCFAIVWRLLHYASVKACTCDYEHVVLRSFALVVKQCI